MILSTKSMGTNKKLIFVLAICVVLVGGYYLFYSDTRTEKEKQLTKQEEVSKSDVIIKELTDKYLAVVGWDQDLIYTLHAQKRLVTGKPTLFRGYVEDVFDRDGKMFIRFSSSFLSSVDYTLELECNQQVVDKIFVQKPVSRKAFGNFFDEYAVVANIQQVARPVFALKGSISSEDEVEVNLVPSELFVAKGTCVDIAYLGYD